MEEQKIFTTSLYGRFGYFVMSIAFLLVVSIFASGLKDMIYGKYTDGFIFGIFIILLEISLSYYLVHCLKYFLSPSFRFKISNDNIVYNGIFSEKSFAFENISGVAIDYGGKSPFIFLLIYSSKRKRPYKLDASGLKPNYEILNQCIKDKLNRLEKNKQ